MSSFIEVNGFKCRYEFNKNPAAKDTIIFINGIASPLESWTPIKEPLETKFNTLAYDMRGQWFSEVATDKPYSFLTMADDLDKLIDKLGIENAHIVGTSLGGEVAQWFALMYPQKTKSLTLVATVSEANNLMCLMVDRWRRAAIEALSSLEERGDCKQTFEYCSDKFNDVFIPDIFSENYISKNISVIDQRRVALRGIIQKTVYEGHIKLSEMFYRMQHEERLTERLHEINCPTLVIGAEFDLVKPASFSTLIAEKIPNAQLHILKDTGHAVLLERPIELTTLIDEIANSRGISETTYNHDYANFSNNKILN